MFRTLRFEISIEVRLCMNIHSVIRSCLYGCDTGE